MPAIVLLGAQWGDEGKGKIVDLLAERFEKIRNSMPKAAPRTLDDQSYLDILGYLLQANGVVAASPGDTMLKPDPILLQSLRIELPMETPAAGSAAGSGRRR